MQNKKIIVALITAGCWLVIATSLWLATAQPVRAQCGSQASSCKDCHETQGQNHEVQLRVCGRHGLHTGNVLHL